MIQTNDRFHITADLHTHTVASTHGYSTVNELAQAAEAAGIRLLAVTDHGPSMPDAPHVWHFHNYKVLPEKIGSVRMLYGVEANITDEFGTLDMDAHELSFCQFVVASYHTQCVKFERTPALVTQGYLKVCEHPSVHVIGHPTTSMFPYDFEPVLRRCKETGKLVEVNESSLRWKPGSAENVKTLLAVCKKYEVPIVVNTDAHYAGLVGLTPLAEAAIRDADFPLRLVMNCGDNTERLIEEYLGRD
jgi:putative hydrolase